MREYEDVEEPDYIINGDDIEDYKEEENDKTILQQAHFITSQTTACAPMSRPMPPPMPMPMYSSRTVIYTAPDGRYYQRLGNGNIIYYDDMEDLDDSGIMDPVFMMENSWMDDIDASLSRPRTNVIMDDYDMGEARSTRVPTGEYRGKSSSGYGNRPLDISPAMTNTLGNHPPRHGEITGLTTIKRQVPIQTSFGPYYDSSYS